MVGEGGGGVGMGRGWPQRGVGEILRREWERGGQGERGGASAEGRKDDFHVIREE